MQPKRAGNCGWYFKFLNWLSENGLSLDVCGRLCERVTPRSASRVLRYRDLLQVEDLFRRAKAILRSRPIYHSSDAAIRGHVFCSFLALMLQKELTDLCQRHALTIAW